MKIINKGLILIGAIVLLSLSACEFEKDKVKSLEGRWKFSIGDNLKWADANFDDSKWDNIRVPDSWEGQGYEGYNGFAWYRRHVRVTQKYKDMPLFLNIGRIDDADEVYFNGVLIGKTGSFPPAYTGKYGENRRYMIPKNLIKYGDDNVIAVRVYDNREDGGIREGEIALYTKGELSLDVDLSGTWKFHLYDSIAWKNPVFDDKEWHDIQVPGYFEDQGYDQYDGFVWYRKKFDIPANLRNKKVVIVMGRIDDIDQVYINGNLIGGIGIFKSTPDSIEVTDAYDEFRGYYLPDNVVLQDTGNLIAVRVFDKHSNGGIYEGPVGIINQENYAEYWEKIRGDHW
jgi:sialate O-acetylesterase